MRPKARLDRLEARHPEPQGGVVVQNEDGTCSLRGILYPNAGALPKAAGYLLVPAPVTEAEWAAKSKEQQGGGNG